jgi:replicative DNA helicase
MTIALTSDKAAIPLQSFMNLKHAGQAVVNIAELLALEEAKNRYEHAWLEHTKNTSTFASRAQQASEPVAQQNETQSPCLRLGDLMKQNETLAEELHVVLSSYARIVKLAQA